MTASLQLTKPMSRRTGASDAPESVLDRRTDQARVARFFHRDPAFLRHLEPLVARYASFFQPEVRGIDHLPERGSVLLVGNHSGGTFMPDMWITELAILARRGLEQPAYALTHNFYLSVPGLRSVLGRIGCIPADPAQAEAALSEGALVLVFPGGDYEACRPWADRNRIDFDGHEGFVRLALRTGTPVVPVVAHGAQHTVVVLSRGERLAHALGLNRLRVKVLPIMLGPPFGVTPIPPLPMPAAITVEFLPPVDWSGLGPEAADDQAVVDACYKEITGLMQATLDRLSDEHPHPLLRGVTQLLLHGPAHYEVPVP